MGDSHLQELCISYKDHQIFTLYSHCTKIYLVLLVFPCNISKTNLLILIDSFYSIGQLAMPKHCLSTGYLCFFLHIGAHQPASGLKGILLQQSAYHQQNLKEV